MTALDLATIPQNIATAESLAAWNLAMLYDLYGSSTYQEVPGAEMTSLVTAMVGKAYEGTQRIIYRASFQLHPEWQTSPNKLWDDVLSFPGDAIIPARYLA